MVPSLLDLSPTDIKVPYDTQANKPARLFLFYLSPLNMVYPLPKPPFLSPTATYSFIEARAAALKITTVVQPLL